MSMPLLGAHMSAAGGAYRAVERAQEVGCACVQLFSKNNNQWSAKPLTEGEIADFKQALADHQIVAPIVHDSYLINLASPADELWKRSIAAMIEELERASALGIPWVITHPGAHTTSSEEEGILRVVTALDQIRAATKHLGVGCLLENTAGQGSSLGHRFEHLAAMLNGVRDRAWLGVCIDTCHLFAAGYPISTKRDYASTFDELDRVIGLSEIKAFHVNDSKRELGSRVDRHEHIGEGKIGLEAFRCLVNDARFRAIPMYMETPKGDRDGEDLDRINLATLRGLVKGSGRTSAAKQDAKAKGIANAKETASAKEPAAKAPAPKPAAAKKARKPPAVKAKPK